MVTVNDRPTVSITISSAAYKVGYSVTVSASASDPDGSIAKVQFYKNNTLAETVSKQPYSYRASRSTVGSDRFHAVATDDDGGTGTSNTATVSWSDPKVLTAIWATDHTPAPGQRITITASTEDFLNPWVGIYNLGRGDMIGDLGNYPAIEDLQKSGDSAYSDTISGSYTIPAATPLGLYTFRADFLDASGQRGVAWLVVDVGGQSANPPPTYQPPSATSTPPGSLPPNDPGSLPPYDDPLYGDPLYGPSDTYLPQVVSQPLWANPLQDIWQSLYAGYGPEDLEPPSDDPYWTDGGYYPQDGYTPADSSQPPAGPSPAPRPANRMPTVSLRTMDSTIPANGSTTLIATASDPDGRIVNYTFYRDGIRVQSGPLNTYKYDVPTAGPHEFTVTVTDRGGRRAKSNRVIVRVRPGSVQWADVNNDGILDRVLATITRPDRLNLEAIVNGIVLYVVHEQVDDLSLPLWDPYESSNEFFSVSYRIPASLTPEGSEIQMQYSFSENLAFPWHNMGKYSGSEYGISVCPVPGIIEQSIRFLPTLYRAVRLGKPSQMVGQLIKTDVNGDGVDDDVQEISTEVLNPDNGNGEMIVVAKCPEGEGAIGCSDAVIKKDEKWSQVEEEENKKSIREILPWSPDYPFICRGTAADCRGRTSNDRVDSWPNYRVFAIPILKSAEQPKGIGFGNLSPLIRVYRPQVLTGAIPWSLPRSARVIPRFQIKIDGVGIRENRDDDNGNYVPDFLDQIPVVGENDLIEVEYLSPQIPEGFDLVIRTPFGLKVWAFPDRDGLVAGSASETVVPARLWPPRSYWVECVGSIWYQNRNLEFVLRPKEGGEDVSIYKIPFDKFGVFLIGLSGETPIVGDRVKAAQANGMFHVSRILYLSGFNIAYYDEDMVVGRGLNTGLGRPFQEVREQIKHCGIYSVGIFGHSRGGGATHNLSWRLEDERRIIDAVTDFTIRYTAYVDAIKADSFESEDRFPPAARFLLNYYQTVARLFEGNLRGTSVVGAENHDLTEMGFGHTGIDNSGYVIGNLSAKIVLRFEFSR